MALSREDYHDVKNAHGKALAKKIRRVTDDRVNKYAEDAMQGKGHPTKKMERDIERMERGARDYEKGNYVRMVPTTIKGSGHGTTQKFSPVKGK